MVHICLKYFLSRRTICSLSDLRWHLVQPRYIQYTTYHVKLDIGGSEEVIRHDLALYGARGAAKVGYEPLVLAETNRNSEETRCLFSPSLFDLGCSSPSICSTRYGDPISCFALCPPRPRHRRPRSLCDGSQAPSESMSCQQHAQLQQTEKD